MLKIVTDSTAYLSKKEIDKLNITIVPLNVQLENDNFEEGTDSNNVFYQKLRASSKLFPTTSQPSIGKFVEIYKAIANEDDDIISIHLSGGISGTVKSAQGAALMLPDYKIHVIDSLTAVAGLGFLVKEAASLVSLGKSKQEVLDSIHYMRENLITLFMVDSLGYLKRGGRIGGAQALLGTLLKVKPILTIKDTITVFQKIRTKQKALMCMINVLEKTINIHSLVNIKVAIMNVDAKKEALEFERLINNKFPDLKIEHCSIGPVIGTHVGPGAIGLAFTPYLPK